MIDRLDEALMICMTERTKTNLEFILNPLDYSLGIGITIISPKYDFILFCTKCGQVTPTTYGNIGCRCKKNNVRKTC